MDIFKQAAQEKLRFATSRGSLTAEQLFDLSISELDALAVSLETSHEQSSKKSFVRKTSGKDKTSKLRFDVALDVLNTKVAEEKELSERKKRRDKRAQILNLIAEKQDEGLKNKSLKQLQALLGEDEDDE